MQKGKIAVIVGPTACGKTALSIEAAKRLRGEVVSADSVQVYEFLDIGSAKPTPEEMQGIPHHLIGEIPLDAPSFTVAEYQRRASAAIDGILERGKLPLIVGGTGLYVNALTLPMDFTEAASDEAFRKQWQAREEQEPGCAHRALAAIDPQSALRLHPNDKKRVIRALEVHHLTGKTMTEQAQDLEKAEPLYDAVMIGLTMPRELLYARVEQRVDQMMKDGLLDEVRGVLERGYDPTAPSLQGLGYKELIAFLQGEGTLEEAVALIKQKTRNFAKRQWTWFRRDGRITWFDTTQYDREGLTEAVCTQIERGLLKEEHEERDD